ncbi:superoxide dismutase family protein [Desulfofustis glycolicus]|uniref:Superoxide dismutase [Cu-Zn] n=1 Tax=Desulfofustis glycolicus DSM 9705 TaxID=1121409 RepID=A0A1M5SXQ7_9BACT|nr:superoxide dismutase family protein [Desulfofustis glycolicus]SHH43321.1 superoxide dismutase, Cu-Zn family [Desulfofustis glycolicus DSM 9705]
MNKNKPFYSIALLLVLIAVPVRAEFTVPMHTVDENGVGAGVGQVVLSESAYGLVLTPELSGLAPGLHGFHVHETPDCSPAEKDGKMVPALSAGGHYDPENSGRHGLPWGDGHLGDLPGLFVDADGTADNPVLAPRLRLSDVTGRSLMIHAGGDNHADHPAPLGGGGARIACGVID